MDLDHLGDAYDFWKGALLRALVRANCLRGLRVDPMRTDRRRWPGRAVTTYARLLAVQPGRIVVHDRPLTADRRAYLAEIPHQCDLFMDPDTGIETSRPKEPQRYLRPADVQDLLDASRGRLVAVYQHIVRQDALERVRTVRRVMKERVPRAHCTAYISANVAMLFFATDPRQAEAVTFCLRHLLLGSTSRRILSPHDK